MKPSATVSFEIEAIRTGESGVGARPAMLARPARGEAG
jgi:hypothetical protein